jgi:uncharacterized protein
MTDLAMIALAVMVAALIQGAIGVGFALIVAPLAAVIRPDLLPGAILILMLPLNTFVAWRERSHFDLRSVSWITTGRFAGTFVGFWILIAVTAPMLNLVVGATTVLAAVATKLAPKFTPSPTAYLGAGLITGVTETATGIGGPPLALVYQHHPPPTLRATMALCFLLGEIFSLAVLAMKGRLGLAECTTAVALVVPLMLGLVGSGWAHRWLSFERLRNALLIFAVVSGVVLMIQSTAHFGSHLGGGLIEGGGAIKPALDCRNRANLALQHLGRSNPIALWLPKPTLAMLLVPARVANWGGHGRNSTRGKQ